MDPESSLRRHFGLSAYEAKVYLALAGERLKVKEVAERSGVPTSRAYDVLRSLRSMGLVTESSGLHEAVRPSAALRNRMLKLASGFEKEQAERETALSEMLSTVEPRFRGQRDADPVLLKGIDGIGAAFIEVLRGSDEVFLLVSKGVEVGRAFLAYISGRPHMKTKVKVLVPRGLRLPGDELKSAKKLGLEVRRGTGVLLDMMVGSGSDVLVGVPARGSDEPFGAVAVWIRNGSFATTLRRSIGQEWKRAEPV